MSFETQFKIAQNGKVINSRLLTDFPYKIKLFYRACILPLNVEVQFFQFCHNCVYLDIDPLVILSALITKFLKK